MSIELVIKYTCGIFSKTRIDDSQSYYPLADWRLGDIP